VGRNFAREGDSKSLLYRDSLDILSPRTCPRFHKLLHGTEEDAKLTNSLFEVSKTKI
jgi:hypothetical protein